MVFYVFEKTPKSCPLMSQVLAILSGEMEIILKRKKMTTFSINIPISNDFTQNNVLSSGSNNDS